MRVWPFLAGLPVVTLAALALHGAAKPKAESRRPHTPITTIGRICLPDAGKTTLIYFWKPESYEQLEEEVIIRRFASDNPSLRILTLVESPPGAENVSMVKWRVARIPGKAAIDIGHKAANRFGNVEAVVLDAKGDIAYKGPLNSKELLLQTN